MDYACQRLSGAEKGAIEAHLPGCADCRTVLNEERALGRSLSAVPVVGPRHDLWQTIRVRQSALDTNSYRSVPSLGILAARRSWSGGARRSLVTALSVAVVAVVLMVAPNPRGISTVEKTAAPGAGAREAAVTLQSAKMLSQKSDDPLQDFSDQTWDELNNAQQGNAS